MEELLTAMLDAVMEGMTEIMGSLFTSVWTEQIPSEHEVLEIAKKYFDTQKELIPKEAGPEFSKDVGDVDFSGMFYDDIRAEELLNKAISMGNDSSRAVATAAAAIGWASAYPGASDALACILDEATFIEDEDKDRDSEKLSRYAIYMEPERPDLYITLARILERKGDRDGALDALNEALKYDPDHEAALKLKKKIE
jgi:tetratricopeptide (TPR) repeat protein